jgi:hypothetical protein
MADPGVETVHEPLSVALEYLMDLRQRQLSEELSEASRRGDRGWIRRLRGEIDLVSRLLQGLRAQRDTPAGIAPTNSPSKRPAKGAEDEY